MGGCAGAGVGSHEVLGTGSTSGKAQSDAWL